MTTELLQALSRLAGNRHSDGVSSLVTWQDREIIINGCHEMLLASRQAPAPQEHLEGCKAGVIASKERLDVCRAWADLALENERLRDRAETAVVAANALQARLGATDAALREQVDACDTDDCEMCHRHRGLLTAIQSPSPQSNSVGIIAAFEQAHPELYWHIAKGKICAGEPLYGAAIFNSNNVEMGHGESDESADEAFRIAIDAATNRIRAALPTTEGSDNG